MNETSTTTQKQPYQPPKIVKMGTLEELVLGGHCPNRELHGGVDSAFPNPSTGVCESP
jgi:hypothetical protein